MSDAHQFRNRPLEAPGNPSTADIARHYIDLGLPVFAIPPKSKVAVTDEWQHKHVGADDCEHEFGGGKNIAARLDNIADCDLDWLMCIPMADYVMAKMASFGRASKPRSHRITRCPEAGDADKCKLVTFAMLASTKGDPRLPSEHALTVAELRVGNKQYTVFPGSTHTSGEAITFGLDGGRSMGTDKYEELREATGLVAFLAVCAQFYPPVGVRNEFNLALGGALLRVFKERPEFKDGTNDSEMCSAVDTMVQLVCVNGGDKGHGRSWTERAATTLAKINDRSACTGMPKVVQLLGLPPEYVGHFAGWLGAKESDFDERPRVLWDDNNPTQSLDATENALIDTETPIYQRGGSLVHVYRQDRADVGGVKRPAGALTIQQISDTRLLEYMQQKIHFLKPVIMKKTGKVMEVTAPPPPAIASRFAARGDRWHMNVLRGVCETPTLRADGTVLCTEGYDASTGVVLNTNDVVYPTVKDEPTREDAEAALAVLKDVIKDFPFAPDKEGAPLGSPSASRSVALAAILTALTRRTMRAAPMFAITAPTMATGKSLYCDVVSLIATGKVAATMAQGSSEEEDEKRLSGALLQGDSILVIDNIARPLEGTFFCSVLTQESVQVRVLGSTGQIHCPTNLTVLVNGNNLVMAKDITTRVLMCRLDAGMESPEKRTFDRDLKTWVPANRPALVHAGLTLLRAYVVAGRPKPEKPWEAFGRFEDWSDLVRGALVWLKEPDPVLTRASVASTDPDREVHHGLMLTLAESPLDFRSTLFTTRDLINYMAGNTDLRQALEAACPRGIVTEHALGRLLRKWAGKPVQGLKLVEKHVHGYCRFQVVAVKDLEPGTQGQFPGLEGEAA